jgi:hypothetical protein
MLRPQCKWDIMNDLEKIRSIKISDTHDLMDIPSEAGTYSKEFENGVVFTITIDKGKMVKHVAKDRKGNSLKTFHLKMQSAPDGQVCYICYQDVGGDYGGPGQVCGRIRCDIFV